MYKYDDSTQTEGEYTTQVGNHTLLEMCTYCACFPGNLNMNNTAASAIPPNPVWLSYPYKLLLSSRPPENLYLQWCPHHQSFSRCCFPTHLFPSPILSAFLAKIWQTMGTPAINAEASQSRRRRAPQANSFLDGASASESDFAWILTGFLIILYLPKITL